MNGYDVNSLSALVEQELYRQELLIPLYRVFICRDVQTSTW